MSTADELKQRMLNAGATRASEPDPEGSSTSLTVVAPTLDDEKETSRLTVEISFDNDDLIVAIASEATRRRPKRKPVIRKAHVIRRTLDLLEAGEEVSRDRLVADLAANPPRDPDAS